MNKNILHSPLNIIYYGFENVFCSNELTIDSPSAVLLPGDNYTITALESGTKDLILYIEATANLIPRCWIQIDCTVEGYT